MLVLGVDAGSRITGFGLVRGDGTRHRAVEFGAIRVPASEPQAKRLWLIHGRLREILDRHRPELVVLEGVFMSRNAQSALKLGQVRGAAMVAALEAGAEVCELSPAEVKVAVTGWGRADKRQVQVMVQRILGLAEPPEPDDAADALALAVAALGRSRWDARTGAR